MEVNSQRYTMVIALRHRSSRSRCGSSPFSFGYQLSMNIFGFGARGNSRLNVKGVLVVSPRGLTWGV